MREFLGNFVIASKNEHLASFCVAIHCQKSCRICHSLKGILDKKRRKNSRQMCEFMGIFQKKFTLFLKSQSLTAVKLWIATP